MNEEKITKCTFKPDLKNIADVVRPCCSLSNLVCAKVKSHYGIQTQPYKSIFFRHEWHRGLT